MNTEQIGVAGILLRAGRAQTTDIIEPTAGFEFHSKIGDPASVGSPLFTIYGADTSLFPAVKKAVLEAYQFSLQKPFNEALILKALH